MSVTKETLVDALNLLATVSLKKVDINELMISMYEDDMIDIDRDNFTRAIKHFYNCRIFPTPREILEITTGTDFNEDWTKIVSIARQTSKEETISGMSHTALLKVTASNGTRSALLAIGRADDIGLKTIARDWHIEIRRVDLSGLPPADEVISLEDKASRDIDYPVDHDYSIRTATLIRLLKNNEIKPETAKAICSKFPACKRIEVFRCIDDGIEVNSKVLELCF
jgi:hypothetical protein